MFSGDYENIKLIDLGVSSKLDKTKATRAAGGGTPRYMPPEQLEGKLSFKVDIWSFGCVLLQFATGIRPFDSIEQDMQLCLMIFGGSNPLLHAEEHNKYDIDMIQESPEFRAILDKCFQKDYTQRPTADQLFKDPFFAEFTTE